MAQVINTNVASLNTQRNLNASKGDLEVALERLSSGQRINSARDDAAGLAISGRFTAQINGLNQAARNSNDGISFAQTAEGAMEEMSNLLQRVRELAVQAANDTNSPSDRRALDQEVQQAIQEIDRIARTTQFNQQNVLDGTLRELVFQVGANRGQAITARGVDVRTMNLGADVIDGLGMQHRPGQNIREQIPDTMYLNGREISLEGVRDENDLARTINELQAQTGVEATQADRVISQPVNLEIPEEGQTARLWLNGVSVDIDGSQADGSMENVAAAINDRAADTRVRLEKDVEVGDQTLDWAFVSNENFSAQYEGHGAITVGGEELGMGLDPEDEEAQGLMFRGGMSLAVTIGSDLRISDDAEGNVSATGGISGLGLSRHGVDQALGPREYTIGGQNPVDVRTRLSASDAIVAVDYALQQINNTRADLGAVQNRFESTINNLTISAENLSASRSRVRDADFAEETAEMTRTQILQQAGTSVLAQANQIPQNVLQLLQQ